MSKNIERRLELISKLIEIGNSLMIEGDEDKDLVISQTGTFIILVAGLIKNNPMKTIVLRTFFFINLIVNFVIKFSFFWCHLSLLYLILISSSINLDLLLVTVSR